MYYKHSGFPGGLTTTSLKEKWRTIQLLLLRESVRGMLPVNKLRDARFREI